MTRGNMFGINRNALAGLRWHGGKSAQSPNGSGRWIASLLALDDVEVYVEPYAGMLGVMLQRTPVNIEIANDLNGRLMNWWRVVRDHPQEFGEYMHYTPDSEVQYLEAMQSLDDGTSIERAAKFQIAISHSLFATDSPGNGGYGVGWGSTSGRAIRRRGGGGPDFVNRVKRLSDRMRHVMLLCRPAVDIIRRAGRSAEALIYVDPPYPDTHSPYGVAELDVNDLKDALLGCDARVAISGYDDQWDTLTLYGWRRSERNTFTHSGQSTTGDGVAARRTEALWTNFDPPTQRELIT